MRRSGAAAEPGRGARSTGCVLSLARSSANSMSMKPRHTATLPPGKCERCESFGRRRWIDDLLKFRMYKIGVFLCEKCYKAFRQADGPAWTWFRKYRDRLISSQEK